jgi:glutaredoxin 3
MNQVKIVTSPTCTYCHAAKSLLDQQGIPYQELDLIKQSEQSKQLIALSGQRTVPQIFIDDKSIGGFSELSKIINKNEFGLYQAQTSI